MGIRIVNKSKDVTFKQFYDDLSLIYKKTLEKLQIKKDYDLSVILVKSKYIQNINREYRNIDKPTDVITFAMQEGESYMYEEEYDLGDIYINIDYVYLQALQYEHSIRREFCFLFVHGLLHALGYDHMNIDDEKVMFELQDEILEPIVKR
ncbi:MAG: rRNA maturation RNase YbeY [Erysipelotrichaceae bacterium]|nr:rRNA maturation RNase YbeY [Erysipelotrichaceae bacterium]